jgi:hypothetical protein
VIIVIRAISSELLTRNRPIFFMAFPPFVSARCRADYSTADFSGLARQAPCGQPCSGRITVSSFLKDCPPSFGVGFPLLTRINRSGEYLRRIRARQQWRTDGDFLHFLCRKRS